MEVTTISWDDFEEKYLPIFNPSDNTAFNNWMFETYGSDLEFVQSMPANRIWTILESETTGAPILMNGFHFVNRIGYIITYIQFENNSILVMEEDE